MKLILVLVVSLLTLRASAIVGGSLVGSESPVAHSTVSLSNGCSGTLIDSQFVLTAAHCVSSSTRSVIFGVRKSAGESVRVDSFVIHDDYNGTLGGGVSPSMPAQQPIADIAVLKLVQSAPEGFVPAKLGSEVELQKGDKVILAGFGQTSPSGFSGSGRLRMVESLFNFYNTKALEIVFGPTPGKSACRGDSGGPMFIPGEDGLHVIGVTSRGFRQLGPCSGNGNYSDVEAYKDWIIGAMDELSQ